ncbi:rrna biogenesis protein rrp36 [Quercus suber]|uniref:rRNA biogenesis protein RRP36 n=1 Tax=Quercus suber TaxID=58331 RepID=A0AAW0JF47_QUESU
MLTMQLSSTQGKQTCLVQRLAMKKTDYPVSNSTKTKFKDSDEYELSSFEHEDRDEHELSSLEDEEEEIECELVDVTFEQLPMKASCKKPVGRKREVVQIPKRIQLAAAGHIRFRSKYNFLFKKYLPDEIKEEQKKLDKSKDPYAVNRFKHSIVWMVNSSYLSHHDKQLKSESVQHIDAAILAEHKKKQREAAKKGKRPFYLSKSTIWKQRLIEKYEYLKASGKLGTFIEKRRKKNVAKDHRYMPYRRS